VADAGQPRLQGRLAGPHEVQQPGGQDPIRRPAAAPAAAAAENAQDLTQIKGIGPRIASILNDGGITNYGQLEHANGGDLRQIIATGGALPPATIDSWPTQASYASRGDWSGLASYNSSH
jgi:predicted flap endonuclease-1-like 5' DNA nuclease